MDGQDGKTKEVPATLGDEKDTESEEEKDTLEEGTNFVRKNKKINALNDNNNYVFFVVS